MSFDRHAREAGRAMRDASTQLPLQEWQSVARRLGRARAATWALSGFAATVAAFVLLVAFAPRGRTPDPAVPIPVSTQVSTTDVPKPTTTAAANASTRVEFRTTDGVTVAAMIGGELEVSEGWEPTLDVVVEQLMTSSRYKLGDTEQQRQDRLQGCPDGLGVCEDDLIVTLTMETGPQVQAEEVLHRWLDDSPLVGVIVLLDNETGAVLAAADTDGRGLWRFRLPSADLATPLAAVAAMEAGYGLDSLWPASSPLVIDLGKNTWTCRNQGGDGGPQETTLSQAIVSAINTAFCQLGIDVGPERIIETMQRLGIESPLNPTPTITLGTQSVTPLEVAVSYATLANGGTRHNAVVIRSVTLADGTVLYDIPTGGEEVVDAEIARAIAEVLQDAVDHGTGTRANLRRAVAGKTGTAQNYRQAWFAGFTPEYTAVVLVTTTDFRTPMVNVEINGQLHERVFGGTVATPMWAEFMETFLDG